MAKTEWGAQYKHPNWQKKRLEALEAAGFECSYCGDKDTTLHVHHKRYFKGRKAWEYELAELEVLCEPCHECAHEVKAALGEFLAAHQFGYHQAFLALLTGYMSGSYEIDIEPGREEQIRQTDPVTYFVGFMAARLHHDTPRKTAALARQLLPLLGKQPNLADQIEALESMERE